MKLDRCLTLKPFGYLVTKGPVYEEPIKLWGNYVTFHVILPYPNYTKTVICVYWWDSQWN